MATTNQALRRIPLINDERRRKIFGRIPEIRETIMKENQEGAFLVSLARSVASGDPYGVLDALDAHPIAGKEIYAPGGSLKREAADLVARLRKFQQAGIEGLIGDKEFTNDEIREYHSRKAAFVQKLASECPGMASAIPVTLNLAVSSLNALPDAVRGAASQGTFSSPFSWIGKNATMPEPPGRIVLVLSGGAAKGMFYAGFIRALREEGFWPDMLVGNSAGAIAAAAMASGKPQDVLENAFAAKTMRRIFNPALAPITLLATAGKGAIGLEYGTHLRKVFGEMGFSDCADCFLVVSVQEPVNFGKAVIGRGSFASGAGAFSSDIPLYMGVWGSSAVQGVIPQPTARPFTAERLEKGVFGTSVHRMELPYATLDDGGVIENLPLETAELLLRELPSEKLVIAVNLSNLNPAKAVLPPMESGGLLAKLSRRLRDAMDESAFRRAYTGFEHIFNQNIVQCVENAGGRGLKILLNPNSDGSLDGIDLLSFRGAGAIRDYGFETGRKLCGILIGDGK